MILALFFVGADAPHVTGINVRVRTSLEAWKDKNFPDYCVYGMEALKAFAALMQERSIAAREGCTFSSAVILISQASVRLKGFP